MTKSLLLDTAVWDLVLDASRNIAVCTAPYSLAQDVATALRTFFGEVYYDSAAGVPYYQSILGKSNPYNVVEAIITAQAMTVPGVVEAKCLLVTIVDRKVTGEVQITDKNGVITNASF